MPLKTLEDLSSKIGKSINSTKNIGSIFSKDYVEFLSEAGWRLEKKLPSSMDNYSDLLEDTDWRSNDIDFGTLKHYRRDLDALS